MGKGKLTLHIPTSMVEDYGRLKQRGLTFAPSFSAFLRQWVEVEIIVQRRNATPYDYAAQLDRALGNYRRRTKELARSGARRRRGQPLGPMRQPSIPLSIVPTIDRARQDHPNPEVRRDSRLAFIRMCVQQGIDVLASEPLRGRGPP